MISQLELDQLKAKVRQLQEENTGLRREMERLRKVASEMRAALELALPYVEGEGTEEETIAVKAAIAHAEELGLEGK